MYIAHEGEAKPMDKDKSGLEVYHQHTYQSHQGQSYKLGFFIPFKDGLPQPPEFWIKSENKKTIFKASGYSDSTWIKDTESENDFRFIDIVKEGLKLPTETSSFLISLWREIHEKWQGLEREARKETLKSPLLKELIQISKPRRYGK
jgi:hypothetical protein